MTAPAPTSNTLKKALWDAMRIHEKDPVSALVAVKAALASGSNPNDGYGTWIPLGWAIRYQAPDIAMILIDAGAKVDTMENWKSLVSMCLFTPNMEHMAHTLIERGAKPNASILRAAAKRGNEKIVQWALDAGVDPNNLSKSREPALNCWPSKVPLPEGLLRATFKRTIADDAACKLVTQFTRRKNLSLLNYFIEHAKVSMEVKYILLKLTVEAKWRVGLELLLKLRYCDPRYRSETQSSPITSCASWISHGKNPNNGLQVLEQLMDYGYDINSTHRMGGSKLPDAPLVVEAFLLLRTTKRLARPALLAFLMEHHLQPLITGAGNTETLAHVLICCNEWELLRELEQAYPGVEWEQAGTTGLLATWARHSGINHSKEDAPDMAPEESLAIVRSLPGFDLQKRNPKGETGLRIFMQRPGGSNFTQMTTYLIQAGLNPFLPDAEGVSDLDYSKTLKLPKGARENLEAVAMLHHTDQATGGAGAARRRL